MRDFNNWLAINVTKALLSIWCAYSFIVLCLLPLVAPRWETTLLYISNCFQLVLLPILGIGQDLMGRDAALQRQQDHAAIMESHEAIQMQLAEIQSVHSELPALCRHPNLQGESQ